VPFINVASHSIAELAVTDGEEISDGMGKLLPDLTMMFK